MSKKIFCLGLLALLPCVASADGQSAFEWTSEFYNHYQTTANITYKETPQGPQKLDVYRSIDAPDPRPTLVFIHGGAWEHGSKDDVLGNTLPWLQKGWTVVNINYRLTKDAPAPAGVEDCYAAMHWVAANASRYGFDLNRLVLSGASAGGHLALLIGLAPPEAGLDPDRSGAPLPQVRAIVNIAGVVDVADLVGGPHRQGFAAAWVGQPPQSLSLARKISPATYVRPSLPPIFTVHGDSDQTIPYGDTVLFHAALSKAGVPNQLLTIVHGGHGGFTADEYLHIYRELDGFLARCGLERSDR